MAAQLDVSDDPNTQASTSKDDLEENRNRNDETPCPQGNTPLSRSHMSTQPPDVIDDPNTQASTSEDAVEENGNRNDETPFHQGSTASSRNRMATQQQLDVSDEPNTQASTCEDDVEENGNRNDESQFRQGNTPFPDPKLHNPSTLDVLGWWAEFSSIHGVYYAFERGHFKLWKQTFWLVVVVLSTSALIATLVVVTDEFRQFSLNTSTVKVTPNSLAFPRVTVCNTNMFDTSLQYSTGIQDPADEEELRQISQPLEDFIRGTSFNQIPRNPSDVWDPIITTYGLCYSFETDEHVFKPGSNAGLQFLAWLDQENYQESEATAGLAVYVTQPGTGLITDQTASVMVPPGQASFVAVELIEVSREREKPWSKCSGAAPNYTNEICRAECIFEATREECDCRMIGDPMTGLPYCKSDDVCSILSDNILQQFCLCETPPCQEQVYRTYYSTARLAEKLVAEFSKQESRTEREFYANVVRVVVNYKSIQYERFSESKATTYSQLISDLGGQMGFYMGISLISIVEIVTLLCLRLLPRLWGDKRLYGIGQKTE